MEGLSKVLRSPLERDDAAAVECERRFTIIRPAIGLAKHSSERRSAIREIVSRDHVGPDGVGFRVSVRTVERYLSEYEANGKAGLLRMQRIDRIERRTRTILTRRWDDAVDCGESEKRRIAEAVRQDLRDLWGSGASYGQVLRLAFMDALARLPRPAWTR